MIPEGTLAPRTKRECAEQLCALVHSRTGATITEESMIAMFASDWNKLTMLAHALHGAQS